MNIRQRITYFILSALLAGIPTYASAQGSFRIENPLGGENATIEGLLGSVGSFIQTIAVLVAVIVIIVSGLRMLWARGNQSEIEAAKKMLWYAIIGLAIVFIGRGFISLIESVLQLGAPPATP